MKKIIFFVASLAISFSASAQINFGGDQSTANTMQYSQKFSDVNYASDDQAYHTMDIYLPKEVKESYPVVVHIYGSAWFSNSSKGMADLNTICAALLDAGYAVVTPNHRSSGDAKYPAQIQDIKAVIRFIRGEAKTYKFDTSFIATSGFSSGGHLATMAGSSSNLKVFKKGDVEYDLEGSIGKYTNQNSRVDAVCDWSGPIDLIHMDCAGPKNAGFSPEEVVMGMPLEGHIDNYLALCSTTHVDKLDPPMIIFHGDQDNVVPYCQSEILHNTLDKAGVRNEFYLIPNGGHGMKMYTKENLGKMVTFLNSVKGKK